MCDRCRASAWPATCGTARSNNRVLRFEWLVESLGQPGQATPVARGGVKQFHVGCGRTATQFLREDQTAVLDSFEGLTTSEQILLAGYVPTHVTVTLVNVGGV